MEHLKLFSTRINIPRLIRVAEEYAHWKELVFLYVQVRSFDHLPLSFGVILCARSPATGAGMRLRADGRWDCAICQWSVCL